MRLCTSDMENVYMTSHLKKTGYQWGINITKTEDILILEYHLVVCQVLCQKPQIREDNGKEDKTTLIIILFELV